MYDTDHITYRSILRKINDNMTQKIWHKYDTIFFISYFFLFFFFFSFFRSSLSSCLHTLSKTVYTPTFVFPPISPSHLLPEKKKHSSSSLPSPPSIMNISCTFTTTNGSATIQIGRSKRAKAVGERERENSGTIKRDLQRCEKD